MSGRTKIVNLTGEDLTILAYPDCASNGKEVSIPPSPNYSVPVPAVDYNPTFAAPDILTENTDGVAVAICSREVLRQQQVFNMPRALDGTIYVTSARVAETLGDRRTDVYYQMGNALVRHNTTWKEYMK